jgi:hypothetical protein
VVSVRFHGYVDVYIMEVDEVHNFVANGIVGHSGVGEGAERRTRACRRDTESVGGPIDTAQEILFTVTIIKGPFCEDRLHDVPGSWLRSTM